MKLILKGKIIIIITVFIVKLSLISQLDSDQLNSAKISSEMSEEIVTIFGITPPTILLFGHTKSEDHLYKLAIRRVS